MSSFVASLEGRLAEWSQLFTQVPAQHERRKEALGGALKIKAAAKRLEKVAAALSGAEESGAGAGADASDETAAAEADGAAPAEAAEECQAVLHEVALGLLEVTFPIHEAITQEDFKDLVGAEAARQRMQDVASLTWQLGDLFGRGGLKPKPMKSSGGDDPLAPQVMKMLEKSVNKQKKKDKKKGGAPSADPGAEVQKAARASWEGAQGRCSQVLGEEVWEGLGWHRGLFAFSYIRLGVERRTGAGPEGAGPPAEGEGEGEAPPPAPCAAMPPPLAPATFSDAMRGFRTMLDAQGPVLADLVDPAEWKAAADGPHHDQTARLHYHGIYTSTHLRALKYLAELSYWRWKHGGQSGEHARLSALINRKFVHVVRHIMPGVGWTADVEYDRIVEMEAQLSCSDFSSGLGAGPTAKPKKKPKRPDGEAEEGPPAA